MSAPEPGWYRDPSGKSETRWWDGSRWTEHVKADAETGRRARVKINSRAPGRGARPRGVPAVTLLAIGGLAIVIGVLIGNLAVGSDLGQCGTVFSPDAPLIVGDLAASLEVQFACKDARSTRAVVVAGLLVVGIICFIIGAMRAGRARRDISDLS